MFQYDKTAIRAIDMVGCVIIEVMRWLNWEGDGGVGAEWMAGSKHHV